MEITDNVQDTGSENQYEDLRNSIMNQTFDRIRLQLISLQVVNGAIDEIRKFIEEYFNYTDIDALETREIYISEVMQSDERNREDLFRFVQVVNNMFDHGWGVRLIDPDIYLVYCLYTVLYLRFYEYFKYFVNGLQKLDEDYVEDLPNYKEYTFAYFIENVSKVKKENLAKNPVLKYPVMTEYIKYILELGVVPELYFQICLMEAEGDVMLSYLFRETANNLLEADRTFFNLKIQKLLEQPEGQQIIDDLVDFI